MKTQKPELSQKLRNRLNEMVALLRQRTWTRQELAAHFQTSDRTVRDMVNAIKKKLPVISTSDREGYKIATCEGDLASVEQTWAEIDSRLDDMTQSKKPLIEFYERHKYREAQTR